MRDEKKTKAKLIEELQQMRYRVAELEAPETGRKQTEEQLRILSSVVDQSVNSIAVLDNEGNVEYVNSKLLEPYEINPEEIIGTNWRSFLSEHSSLRSRYDEMRSTVLEEGEVWRGEVSDRTVNGETIWREATVFPIVDASGTVTHSVYMSQDITDRKQAEQERVRLTAILENTSDMVSTALPDQRITYMNRAGKEMLGWPNENISIDKDIHMAHPQWAAEMIEKEGVSTAIRDGIWRGETALLGTNGTEIPVSQVIMSHKSSTGELEYLSTIIRDISERKQAEEVMRQSEETLKVSQEIGHIGSWSLDLEKNDLLWSDEVYRIFGLMPQQFDTTYEVFLEAVHPDDREMVNSAYTTAIKTHAPYEVVHRVLRPNGEVRIVREKSVDIADESGRIVRSVGMIHDITEQKLAEEALRDSEEKLRSILESSPDAITVTNLEAKLTDCNPATLSMHGFDTMEELIGMDTLELIKPEDHQRAVENIQRTLDQGTAKNIEYTFLRKDGTEFLGEISASVIRDVFGNPVSFVAITKDIAERRQAEEVLRESEGKFRSIVNSSPMGMHMYQLESDGPLQR